jgi:putative nucleotidyltransferase with HDIG domain
MESNKRLEILQSYIRKLPSFPTTVNKVMEICYDANTSPADLSRVISLDPVLSGKVMQLVNSAYFGFAYEIVSLVKAIIMLGMNTVKNLALGIAVMSVLGSRKNFHALDMEAFWRHSLGVGVISKLIAKKRNVTSKKLEGYFIAGLLHDIGKIPLNGKFSDEYRLAMEISEKKHQPLSISERQVLGIDHTLVGNLIAENWNLGTEIIDTVTYHHSPETYKGEQKDILFTIILANHFANRSGIGFSGDPSMEEIWRQVFEHFSICQNTALDYLHDFTDEATQEIENAQVFLKIAR